jgi:DNA-binding response OmpR family regulator
VRTIYHVDDDPDFLEEVRSALCSRFAVRSFADPRQLRKAIRGHAPDLLLLDLEMPGLSGHDILGRLRASPQTQDTPVVFLTGRSDRADRLRALAGGLDDYVCKPPDIEELVSRMENLLRRRPARNAPVLAFLRMERYTEACAAGLENVADNVISRASAMIRLSAGASCIAVRQSRDCTHFSGACPDVSRAHRIAGLFNRLLLKKGPLLVVRNGYLEEAAAPALRFEQKTSGF